MLKTVKKSGIPPFLLNLLFLSPPPHFYTKITSPLCLIFGDLIPLKFPLCKLDCDDSRVFTADTIHTAIVYPSHRWNHLWPLCFVNFCIVVCILDFVALSFKKQPSQIIHFLNYWLVLLTFPNRVFTIPLDLLYYHLSLVLETPRIRGK